MKCKDNFLMGLGVFLVVCLVGCSSTGSLVDKGTDGANNAVDTVEDIQFTANIILGDGSDVETNLIRFGYDGDLQQGYGNSNALSSGNVFVKEDFLSHEGDYNFVLVLKQDGITYAWSTQNVTVELGSALDFGDLVLEKTGTANLDITLDGLGSLSSYSYAYNVETSTWPYNHLIDAVSEAYVSNGKILLGISLPVLAGAQDITISNIDVKDSSNTEYEYEDISFEAIDINSGATTQVTGSVTTI